jgi:hypothetical protein
MFQFGDLRPVDIRMELYCQIVEEDGTEANPIGAFLRQPAHRYEEDLARDTHKDTTVRGKVSFLQRLRHFMFEKEPSPYSSIAPRMSDGTRTKIFFFNGNGRGR